MRIAESSVSLRSAYTQERVTATTESLELWVGRAPQGAAANRATPAIPATPATPAIPGLAPATPAVPATPASKDAELADGEVRAKGSPRDELDLEILRKTFRLARRLTRAADEIRRAYADEAGTAQATRELGEKQQDGQRLEGWGLRYDATTVTTEREAVSFSADAHVATADGRTIDVSAALAMARESTTVQTVSVRAGDAAARVDPLVLDLGTGPAALDGRMSLDLDGDGVAERTAAPGAGGAFLARDLDADGVVDSGRELFGPATGDGFGELAALDGDGNGWVDEGDAAWSSLALWNPASPGALTALGAAGVGALYTGSAATPFTVAGGAVASTGLYLREDGTAGTVRHVDLDV